MHHHGKGVYSGTFSGTLNPALQDHNGQPKRDISTIIHILNDLLCAQYKNYRSHSKPGPSSTTSSSAKSAAGVGPNGQSGASSTAGGAHHCPNPPPDQLQVTKGKMEQLRRIMEERKARRRARREARAAPYSTSWSVKSKTTKGEEDDDSSSSAEAAPSTGSGAATAASSASGSASGTSATGEPMDLFNPELEPMTA